MKRSIYFILLVLLGVACQKENLTPSDGVENYFEVPDNATDPESVLRRTFYEQTGCYLLFNDTLRKEFIRLNDDGEPVYSSETLDLGYGIMAASKNKYSFRYMNSLKEKENAVEFVKDRILPLMEKKNYPYSLLLVDSVFETYFYVDDDYFRDRQFLRYFAGTRCLAASLGNVNDLEEEEQKNLVKEIFAGLIKSKLTVDTKLLEDFNAYGKALYGKTLYMGWEIEYIEDLRELGFFSGDIGYDYYEDADYCRCPSWEEDLDDFLQACFQDEEEFLTENESYPLVIEKYKSLKGTIVKLGFDLKKLQ